MNDWDDKWFPLGLKMRPTWIKVFHPVHTAWDANHAIYPAKLEALRVLFMSHDSFRRSGIKVIHEFALWCEYCERGEERGEYKIETPGKACEFLRAYVNNARTRWAERNNNTTLEAECAVYAFRNAVSHLDALAKWQGFCHGLIKTEEVKVYQVSLLKAQAIARADVRDYAASSRFLNKRVSPEEVKGIAKGWWEGRCSNDNEWLQVRGLLINNLQMSLGRRGADLRNIRMAMMFVHKIRNTLPVEEINVIGASLRHVKESHDNVEHLLGWMRTRDREKCPLTALAHYMVYLNDIRGISLLDMVKDPSWHERMLIIGKDPNAPISYTTHNLTCHAGMDTANIKNKTAVTHLPRNVVSCDMIENGVQVNDAGMYCGWYHNTATDIYLRGAFKTHPMLVAHGWRSRDKYECWWDTDPNMHSYAPTITHIHLIQEVVFPKLKETTDWVREERPNDKSAQEFMKVLKLLQTVFIIDAVHFQDIYPEFPTYKRHKLFANPSPQQHTAWLTFKHHAQHRLMHPQQAVHAAQASQAPQAPISLSVDLAPPPQEDRIPLIKEPVDMYSCYKDWCENCKEYFAKVVRPPWKKELGKHALAHRLRYCKMRPYFIYLDRQKNPRAAIDVLDAIRKKHGVSVPAFIKQCFYYVFHDIPDDSKKPPPLNRDVMLRETKAAGLVLLTH